jgi:thiazole synthase ThiGH ThiG subunit
MIENNDKLEIGGEVFNSRLFLGTGKFESGKTLHDAVLASGSQWLQLQ